MPRQKVHLLLKAEVSPPFRAVRMQATTTVGPEGVQALEMSVFHNQVRPAQTATAA